MNIFMWHSTQLQPVQVPCHLIAFLPHLWLLLLVLIEMSALCLLACYMITVNM
jgi:hypothetical protein